MPKNSFSENISVIRRLSLGQIKISHKKLKLQPLAEKIDLGFSCFFIGPSWVFHFYTVATLLLVVIQTETTTLGLGDSNA